MNQISFQCTLVVCLENSLVKYFTIFVLAGHRQPDNKIFGVHIFKLCMRSGHLHILIIMMCNNTCSNCKNHPFKEYSCYNLAKLPNPCERSKQEVTETCMFEIKLKKDILIMCKFQFKDSCLNVITDHLDLIIHYF